MTTTAKRTGELEKLTKAFWAHLRAHPALPEPCTVTLDPWKPEVQVQAAPARAATHLGELLLWASTLDSVTAEWWHTNSDRLHITLRGRAAGTRFYVYGGIPYTGCAELMRLDVDEHEGVSVDEISTLRELLDEQQTGMAGVIT
jgi:hypothetical protein